MLSSVNRYINDTFRKFNWNMFRYKPVSAALSGYLKNTIYPYFLSIFYLSSTAIFITCYSVSSDFQCKKFYKLISQFQCGLFCWWQSWLFPFQYFLKCFSADDFTAAGDYDWIKTLIKKFNLNSKWKQQKIGWWIFDLVNISFDNYFIRTYSPGLHLNLILFHENHHSNLPLLFRDVLKQLHLRHN